MGFETIKESDKPINTKQEIGNLQKNVELAILSEDIIKEKYKDIIEKYPNTSKRIIPAIKELGFYPESRVLEYFIKMGIQESSLSWSPKMDYSKSGVDGRKKKEIKDQLDFAIETVNSFMGKTLLMFDVIDEKEEINISELISSLNQIYRNKNTTEYDFYLWTQKVSEFFKGFRNNHCVLDKMLGSQIDEVEKKINHIPSTFGIWQINVDLFLEKIQKNGIINKYGEISNLKGEELRHEMVKALCGKSDILNKDRTMQLIFEGHLKTRYENHNRGENDDLKYMVIENLTGEMSTYYASIQEKLNKELGINIKVDGILTIRKNYSKEIDYEKTKNYGASYKALLEYIDRKAPGYKDNSEKLIREIYEADSWEKLSKSELYKTIMGDDFGKRSISDNMGSHNQTAEKYFDMIERK